MFVPAACHRNFQAHSRPRYPQEDVDTLESHFGVGPMDVRTDCTPIICDSTYPKAIRTSLARVENGVWLLLFELWLVIRLVNAHTAGLRRCIFFQIPSFHTLFLDDGQRDDELQHKGIGNMIKNEDNWHEHLTVCLEYVALTARAWVRLFPFFSACGCHFISCFLFSFCAWRR